MTGGSGRTGYSALWRRFALPGPGFTQVSPSVIHIRYFLNSPPIPWIALAQWFLVALTLAGLIWIVLILAIGGSSGPHKSSSLINDVSLAPWLGVMVVALLLLGWLISSWCQNMVVLAADREREQAVRDILARIAAVTNDLVVVPVGRELRDYEHYRTELAAVRDS